MPLASILGFRRSWHSSSSGVVFAAPCHGRLLSRRYYEGSDSCTAHSRCRSPRLSHAHFPTFRLQTRGCPGYRFVRQHQRIRCVLGFVLSQKTRRHAPPNRVRHPTDRQFAYGCSPHHLTATQLPSATRSWLTPTRTFTVLCARIHERTRSGRRALAGERPGLNAPGNRRPPGNTHPLQTTPCRNSATPPAPPPRRVHRDGRWDAGPAGICRTAGPAPRPGSWVCG